jgi:hypothetical protein
MSSSPGRGRPGRSPGTSKSWKTSPRTWPASAAFARDLELELTADYLVKRDEERERIHAERERQKEEEAACRDFEREKTRPMKEQAYYSMALARLHELGDSTVAAEVQEHLDQVTQSIADVDRRRRTSAPVTSTSPTSALSAEHGQDRHDLPTGPPRPPTIAASSS